MKPLLQSLLVKGSCCCYTVGGRCGALELASSEGFLESHLLHCRSLHSHRQKAPATISTIFLFGCLLICSRATMGLAYFAFIVFNKDQGSTAGGDTTSSSSMEDPIEEARKIMDKYN